MCTSLKKHTRTPTHKSIKMQSVLVFFHLKGGAISIMEQYIGDIHEKIKNLENKMKYIEEEEIANIKSEIDTLKKELQIVEKEPKDKKSKIETKEEDNKKIEKINSSKTNKKNSLSGNVMLTMIASVLIVLSAVTFVGSFWSDVHDGVKVGILCLTGIIAQIVGCKLYEAKKLYPFIMISSIGIALVYIGVMCAYGIYSIFTEFDTAILIIILSSISSGFYSVYGKKAMLIVNSLGIISSTFLISQNLASNCISDGVIYSTGIIMLLNYMPFMIRGLVEDIFAYDRLNSGEAVTQEMVSKGIEDYKLITGASAILGLCLHGYNIKTLAHMVTGTEITVSVVLIAISLGLLVYRMNPIGKLKSLVYLTEVQLATYTIANMCSMIFSDRITILVYLVVSLAIAFKEIDGYRTYKYVALNIGYALFELVMLETSKLDTIWSYQIAMLVGTLQILAVGKLINTNGERIFESYLSMIPLITQLITVELSHTYVDGEILFGLSSATYIIVGALAIITMIREINVTLWVNTSTRVHTSEAMQILVDIASMFCIFKVLDSRYAFILASVYFAFIYLSMYMRMSRIYKLAYIIEVSILALILMIDTCLTGGLVFAISNIMLIGLMQYHMIKNSEYTKEYKTLTSILWTIEVACMTATIGCLLDGGDFCKGYISIVGMIGSSSVLLMESTVKLNKPMRITSTLLLLYGIWSLIGTLEILNSTMGAVLALFISGLIVLGVSIVCSKLEQKDEGDIDE